MYIRLAAVAALLTASAVLAGCGTATSNVAWQDALRDELDKEFANATETEMADTCLGLSLFELDTPEEVGAMIFAFDETGELPDGDVTVAEWAESEGESLDALPFSIDPDLTVREIAVEAGSYLLDKCGVTYE